MDDKSETAAAYWNRLKSWALYILFVLFAIVVNGLLMKWLGSNVQQIPTPPPPIIVVSPGESEMKVTVIYPQRER